MVKHKQCCPFLNRFLSKYPEYPKANEFIEIGLDDVAKDLSKKNMFILEIHNNLSCTVRGNQDKPGNLVEHRLVLVCVGVATVDIVNFS